MPRNKSRSQSSYSSTSSKAYSWPQLFLQFLMLSSLLRLLGSVTDSYTGRQDADYAENNWLNKYLSFPPGAMAASLGPKQLSIIGQNQFGSIPLSAFFSNASGLNYPSIENYDGGANGFFYYPISGQNPTSSPANDLAVLASSKLVLATSNGFEIHACNGSQTVMQSTVNLPGNTLAVKLQGSQAVFASNQGSTSSLYNYDLSAAPVQQSSASFTGLIRGLASAPGRAYVLSDSELRVYDTSLGAMNFLSSLSITSPLSLALVPGTSLLAVGSSDQKLYYINASTTPPTAVSNINCGSPVNAVTALSGLCFVSLQSGLLLSIQSNADGTSPVLGANISTSVTAVQSLSYDSSSKRILLNAGLQGAAIYQWNGSSFSSIYPSFPMPGSANAVAQASNYLYFAAGFGGIISRESSFSSFDYLIQPQIPDRGLYFEALSAFNSSSKAKAAFQWVISEQVTSRSDKAAVNLPISNAGAPYSTNFYPPTLFDYRGKFPLLQLSPVEAWANFTGPLVTSSAAGVGPMGRVILSDNLAIGPTTTTTLLLIMVPGQGIQSYDSNTVPLSFSFAHFDSFPGIQPGCYLVPKSHLYLFCQIGNQLRVISPDQIYTVLQTIGSMILTLPNTVTNAISSTGPDCLIDFGNAWLRIAAGQQGLVVVKYCTPTSLVLSLTGTNSYANCLNLLDITSARNLDFIACAKVGASGANGVLILDTSGLPSLSVAGFFTTPAPVKRVYTHGFILAALDSNNSCHLINSFNPSQASLLSSINISDGPVDLAFHENLLFIATGQGVQIFLISDPQNPIEKQRIPIVGGLNGIAISGNKILAATNNGAIQIDFDQAFWTYKAGAQAPAGNYPHQSQLINSLGVTGSSLWQMDIQGPPTAVTSISMPKANIGSPYSFSLPQGSFSSPNGGDVRCNFLGLPPGLVGTSSCLISGAAVDQPSGQSNAGTYPITIQGIALNGGTNQINSNITVSHLPQILNRPGTILADINQAKLVSLITTALCIDPGCSLSYSLVNPPAGISLNNGNLSILLSTAQTVQLQMNICTDQLGCVPLSFFVSAAPFPKAPGNISPLLVLVGQFFSINLPSFQSESAVSLSPASPLPAGTSLNGQVFSGTIAQAQNISLGFIGQNVQGGTASYNIGLRAVHAVTPDPAQVISRQYVAAVGEPWELDTAMFRFLNPNDASPPVVSLVNLLDWLQKNGSRLSGTPSQEASQYLRLQGQPLLGTELGPVGTNSFIDLNILSRRRPSCSNLEQQVLFTNQYWSTPLTALAASGLRYQLNNAAAFLRINNDRKLLEGIPQPADSELSSKGQLVASNDLLDCASQLDFYVTSALEAEPKEAMPDLSGTVLHPFRQTVNASRLFNNPSKRPFNISLSLTEDQGWLSIEDLGSGLFKLSGIPNSTKTMGLNFLAKERYSSISRSAKLEIAPLSTPKVAQLPKQSTSVLSEDILALPPNSFVSVDPYTIGQFLLNNKKLPAWFEISWDEAKNSFITRVKSRSATGTFGPITYSVSFVLDTGYQQVPVQFDLDIGGFTNLAIGLTLLGVVGTIGMLASFTERGRKAALLAAWYGLRKGRAPDLDLALGPVDIKISKVLGLEVREVFFLEGGLRLRVPTRNLEASIEEQEQLQLDVVDGRYHLRGSVNENKEITVLSMHHKTLELERRQTIRFFGEAPALSKRRPIDQLPEPLHSARGKENKSPEVASSFWAKLFGSASTASTTTAPKEQPGSFV